MAILATDFSEVERFPLGPGKWLVTGRWKPSGTYTSGGEGLTDTIVKGWGLSSIDLILFGPLIKGDQSDAVQVSFDRNRAGGNQGKIHVHSTVPAHAHPIKITGGQAAGTALQFTPDTDAGIIGKTAATTRTLAGGTDNILNNTVVVAAGDVAGGTDFSTGTYYSDFIAIGS